MSPEIQPWTKEQYDQAAADYLAKLPLSHFMEAEPQAIQRSITLDSFRQLAARIPQFHWFSELLVQYRINGELRQVVPDNMVVLGPLAQDRRGSFAVEREQSPLLWTLEYVSQSNKRKDYVDSFQKYEELKVPYYLIYDPDERDLRFFRHDGDRYVQLKPDDEGRYAIPELGVQAGVEGEWVRYWHAGESIEMSPDLAQNLREARQVIQQQHEELELQKEIVGEMRGELETQQERLIQTRKVVEQKDQLLSQKDQLLSQKDQLLSQQNQQLAHKDEQLTQKDQRVALALTSMRAAVTRLARQAGRGDILAAAPASDDFSQLQNWLDELMSKAG